MHWAGRAWWGAVLGIGRRFDCVAAGQRAHLPEVVLAALCRAADPGAAGDARAAAGWPRRSLRRLPVRLAQDNEYGAWVPFGCTVGVILLGFYGLAYSLFPLPRGGPDHHLGRGQRARIADDHPLGRSGRAAGHRAATPSLCTGFSAARCGRSPTDDVTGFRFVYTPGPALAGLPKGGRLTRDLMVTSPCVAASNLLPYHGRP